MFDINVTQSVTVVIRNLYVTTRAFTVPVLSVYFWRGKQHYVHFTSVLSRRALETLLCKGRL